MSVPMLRHVTEPVANGPLRRWLRAAFKSWQRRKMMASLSALDDRTLHDIGIHRSEIARAVDGFDGIGGRMVPLVSSMPRHGITPRHGGLKTKDHSVALPRE
nr:DUF1127 domain-containing protein [Hyphomonas sp. 34-62-18]